MSVYETSQWESPELEFGEMETGEFGEMGESESSETEGFLGGLLSSVLGGAMGESGPLTEVQEMEAANALLEVSSEAELDRFLGNLFKKVASGVGGFLKSGTGQALGGILKNVAKKALPLVGGALGSFVAPGVGTALGSKLGSMASNLFEVELEGLGEQEAEFEVARRYVRFASTAARNAATAPRNAPPQAVARAAVVAAARKHAPGLVRGTPYAVSRRPRGTAQQPQRSRPTGRPRSRAARGGYGYSYGYPVEGGTFTGAGAGADDDEPWGGDDAGYDGDGDGDGFYDGDGSSSGRRHRAQRGRWVRRGNKIVILGS